MSDKKYITLSPDKHFQFMHDSDFLNYEPVNVIHGTIETMASKVAEGMDTVLIEACMKVDVDPDALIKTMKRVRAQEAEIERLNRIIPPCKIGDEVWVVRNYSGKNIIVSGKVSEMLFNDDMSICIVVKNVARGLWGEKIFGSYEEAKAWLEG